MSIDILKKQLKENRLSNLYLFYGQEEYLKKYYLDCIARKLIPDDGLKALNKVVAEGKLETSKIVDLCETLPAFSDKKLVVVKNSGMFKPRSKSGAEESGGKHKNDGFLDYLQNLPGHVCLVFYEEEIDKRIKAVDIVKKHGLVVEFPFQKPAELVKWVAKVFSAFKKEIDPLAASRLVENCEQGMNDILNEVNKLVQFAGERNKITSEDIDKVCTRSVKTRIFDLTDAVAEKNRVKALKLLDDMITMKEPLPKILFMINRHLRQMLEIKLLSGEGISLNSAAARMGVTPYAAGKILKQSGSFSVQDLKKALEESLKYDLAVKRGQMKDRIAVELLITKLST